MAEPLLTPDFLHKLEQLELTARRILLGRLKGERRSRRRGSSVEFADHKPYTVGDDLRFIDWNILIRLDRLFLKLFEEEEDLHFHLLVDISQSMTFGEPTKLRYAKQVAAALAFIGLVNLDKVWITPFARELGPSMPAARGRRALWRVLDYLDRLEAAADDQDGSRINSSLKEFALRHAGRGIVVLLSDLLDKDGYADGLRYLLAKNCEIYVLHILADEELEPAVVGDLALVDVEDGDVAEITANRPLMDRYRSNVASFRAAARDFCARRGITYLFTTNHQSFEALVLRYFRERGLVR